MKAPLFIRPLSLDERLILEAGLHADDPFTRRRCQILLANAEGKTAPKIATQIGCALQTVLNALNAFMAEDMGCVRGKKPHRTKLDASQEPGRPNLHDCRKANGLTKLTKHHTQVFFLV